MHSPTNPNIRDLIQLDFYSRERTVALQAPGFMAGTAKAAVKPATVAGVVQDLTQSAVRRFPGQTVLGVRIDDVPPHELVVEMARSMAARDRLLVMHVNAWLLTLAKDRPWLRRQMSDADIVYADGIGAQLAQRLLTGVMSHRSSAPEWIDQLGQLMAAQGSSVFWLGSRESIIQRAAQNHAAATGVRLAGWHHGYFDKTPGSAESRAVVDAINASRADFLIVNMGMPIQEKWLNDHWFELNVSVALTAGAMADRVAGLVTRPPAWVTSCGLEWLTRLIAEPRRLGRRYLIGLPTLALQISQEALSRRDPLTKMVTTGPTSTLKNRNTP